MSTDGKQPDEYTQPETESECSESASIRWVLPTSKDKFINRLKVYVNRLPPIKTRSGVISFSRIVQRSNGSIEILGDWSSDGQLQDRPVDMVDLTISELKKNRIEITFARRILPPNYVAWRDQLAAMIDEDFLGTRTTRLEEYDRTAALEVVVQASNGKINRVRGPADSPLMHRLAQGQVPKELTYRPWRPFFEMFIATQSAAVLDVLERFVSQYQVLHPELLGRVSFRRNGLIYVMIDDFWTIVDVDIVADDGAHRVGVRLALVEYDDDSEIPNARELQALAHDVGHFLRDELTKLYGRPDKPLEMNPGTDSARDVSTGTLPGGAILAETGVDNYRRLNDAPEALDTDKRNLVDRTRPEPNTIKRFVSGTVKYDAHSLPIMPGAADPQDDFCAYWYESTRLGTPVKRRNVAKKLGMNDESFGNRYTRWLKANDLKAIR